MPLFQLFMTEIFRDKYENAISLYECKTDSESEPYKSKYKARIIFNDLLIKSTTKYSIDDKTENDSWAIIISILDFYLGCICSDCEEITDSKNYFLNALNRIENISQSVAIKLSILNNLGILFSSLNESEKALHFLEKSEQLFNNYNLTNSNPPKSCNDFVYDTSNSENASRKSFEDNFTLNLYYQAQVHGNIGNCDLSAEYIKRTLVRQLLFNTYEPTKWALDAAALSQYYVSNANFRTARKCLAASQHILSSEGDTTTPLDDPEESRERIVASVNRCWTKYIVELLEKSWSARQNDESKPSLGIADETPVPNATADDGVDFNIDYATEEDKLTSDLVTTYEDARLLFVAGMDKTLRAQKFYSLDGYCCDYVEIARDRSQLFKLLANFEEDDDRRAKMHKRRADLLLPLSNELSKQHYMLIYRQLVFELGEIYGAILDVKLSALENNVDPSLHVINKVNTLITSGLVQFTRYLDTLKEPSTNNFPDKLSSEDERPCMIAKFYNARLYSKFVTNDVEEKINNLNLSAECYKFISDYCMRHDSAKEVMKLELAICDEMIVLLPAKIKIIYQNAQS